MEEPKELEGLSIGKVYTTEYPPLREATEADIRIERTCQVFSTDKERKACEKGFKEGVNYSIEAIEFVKRKEKSILK